MRRRKPLKKEKPIKRRSERKILLDKCYDYIRKILKIKHNNKCQICGRTANNLGVFHILPRGAYPRIQLLRENLLLVCWFPCHYSFHHDFKKALVIEKRIKEICGEDYEEKLLQANLMHERLTTFNLSVIKEALKQELEQLKKEQL